MLKPTGAFTDSYVLFKPQNLPAQPKQFPVLQDGQIPATLPWVDTAHRAQVETNDNGGTPSRSGDIVLILNGPGGFISVHEADILKGWHGSPSQAESNVPMLFSFPGAPTDFLGGVVSKAVSDAKKADSGGQLRSFRFRSILDEIGKRLKAGK